MSLKIIKKLLSAVLLTAISTSVLAEWTFVVNSSDHTVKVYIEKSSIRKNQAKVKMWHLLDLTSSLSNENGTKFLSAKELIEYDCKNEQARQLAFAQYSSNMGGGDVVITDATPQDWSPVFPDSITQSLMQKACKN